MKPLLKYLLFIFLLLATAINVNAQKLYLKFASQGIMNSSQKAVSGFDDGKEFMSVEDMGAAMFKLYSSDTYYFKAYINGNKQLTVYSSYYSQEFKFSLNPELGDGSTGDLYWFTGYGVEILVYKNLNRVIILSSKVDKNGEKFLYSAVFGQPL